MFLPAHYLKKFHPSYTPKEDIEKLAQAAGFKNWTELFATRNAPPENPERPTMAAWAPVTRVSDPVFTLRRNPYFIGVDPAGNQLPYIDEVRFTYFADAQALNLQAIAGNFDMQARHIQMTNYPVFKEQEKNGKYHVITWPTFGGSDAVIAFNQTYTADPAIGKLMATKDFRVALSLRHQPRPDQGVGVPRPGRERARPCRRPGIRTSPARNGPRNTPSSTPTRPTRCSTRSGLTKRDAQGIRLMENGKPATIEISVVPAFGAWPDVGAACRQGLGGGRHQDRRADPRTRAAFQHARRQPAHDARSGTRTPPASPSPAIRRSTRATRRS